MKSTAIAASLVAALALGACTTTNPYTGQSQLSNTAGGTLIGVLIIGVLVSMFSAIVVTRSMMRVVVRREWARNARLFGLREEEFIAVGASRPSHRPIRADV